MEESVSTVSENTEEAGQIALEKLRETVARDFLGSEAVYQSFKSLVSREQYASIRTEYVRGWFRDNLDPEFLQPSDEQLEIIANSTGNTLVTARPLSTWEPYLFDQRGPPVPGLGRVWWRNKKGTDLQEL